MFKNYGSRRYQPASRRHRRVNVQQRQAEAKSMPVRKAVACLCSNKGQVPGDLWAYVQRLIDFINVHQHDVRDVDGLMRQMAALVDYDPALKQQMAADPETQRDNHLDALLKVKGYFEVARSSKDAVRS